MLTFRTLVVLYVLLQYNISEERKSVERGDKICRRPKQFNNSRRTEEKRMKYNHLMQWNSIMNRKYTLLKVGRQWSQESWFEVVSKRMPDKHLNFDDLWVAEEWSWRLLLLNDYVKEIGRSSPLLLVDWIDRLQSSKVVIAVMAVHYRSGNNDVWAKVATHEDQRLQHCPHFCCSLWSHKIGEEEPFTFSSATSKGQPWHLFWKAES